MATLIPADGSVPRYVTPARGEGTAFTLQELQTIVGGYIEALRSSWLTADDGQPLIMFLNEDGKREDLPLNRFATALMRRALQPEDYIVGDVVLCTYAEAGEGGDEDDEDADGGVPPAAGAAGAP
jgi:hypothetical protein